MHLCNPGCSLHKSIQAVTSVWKEGQARNPGPQVNQNAAGLDEIMEKCKIKHINFSSASVAITIMKVKVAQSCPTLCNPMDCSPPGSCVHGILQARILEWVAMPSSRGSSRPQGSDPHLLHCRQRFFTIWLTREAHYDHIRTFLCQTNSEWYRLNWHLVSLAISRRDIVCLKLTFCRNDLAWKMYISWTSLVVYSSLVGYSPWGHKDWGTKPTHIWLIWITWQVLHL